MRRAGIAALVLALGAGGCGGGMMQGMGMGSSQSASVVESYDGRVPAGTTLWVELDETVGKNSFPGQTFTARVKQDVATPEGELLIPKGSRVYGRVGEVRHPQGNLAGAIRLDVESIEIQGMRQQLRASIVETQVGSGRHVRGRDVAIGAGAGALLGMIVSGGDLSGAVVGGAVGAGGGALVSLGTTGGEAALPRGTDLALRLERPIRSLALLRGDTGYY
jgi:hypothetical protein